MQGGRIEISSVRPDKSAYLWIHFGGKELRVSKGPIELTFENRLEVDELYTAVVESNPQAIAAKSIHRDDAADWVFHRKP